VSFKLRATSRRFPPGLAKDDRNQDINNKSSINIANEAYSTSLSTKPPIQQTAGITVKKILVTGASGFIGSHLVELCLSREYEVVAFVRYDSRGIYPWLDNARRNKQFNLVRGDIRDFDSVKAAIGNCDSILHLAALVGIPYSYESPLAYIRTNIEGTYNILQLALERSIANILVTSTSETYGTAQYVPIDENHPAVGQSPYAASKVAADQISLSFHRSFGTPVKVIRPFNTYGPRQSARAIIPTVISQILTGNTEIRLGNTTPTRDLTFVADTAEGFLSVAESRACIGQSVNLGTGTEISIGALVAKIAKIMAVQVDIVIDEERLRPETSEVQRLLSDNSKVRRLTGWAPKFDLDQGLKVTIDWLKKHQGYYKADKYEK